MAISSSEGSAGAPFSVMEAQVQAALGGGPVPILALRIRAFEQIAWRQGRSTARRHAARAARVVTATARRVCRAGDLLGHNPEAALFVLALLDPSREGGLAGAHECRTVLERVEAAVCAQVPLPLETGWTVARAGAMRGIAAIIDEALERGLRERERYEFFAVVGHELRTPLTSIRGYLETILEHRTDPSTAQRFLEIARREALRLGRLVEGMLDFSLLDLSADAFALASCDLGEQLDVACDALAGAFGAAGVRVERIPVEPLRVGLAPDACVQILLNLLDNAIKYGRPGGQVRIVAEHVPRYARLWIEDDGPGVPELERDTIFAARRRGSTACRSGSGVGLAIVRTIIERAGGEVAVDRSSLGGARFIVDLPLRAESVALTS